MLDLDGCSVERHGERDRGPDRAAGRRDGAQAGGHEPPCGPLESTSNPPRSRGPRRSPDGHSGGSAGSSSMPSCDCTSISHTAATAPRLPSIWKTVSGFVPPGGERSSRLGSVLLRRIPYSCSCAAAPSWKRAQSSESHATLQPPIDRSEASSMRSSSARRAARASSGVRARRDLSIGVDGEEMGDVTVARLPLDVVLPPLLELAAAADAHRGQARERGPQLGAEVLVDPEHAGGPDAALEEPAR